MHVHVHTHMGTDTHGHAHTHTHIMPVTPSPRAVAGSPIEGPLHRGWGRQMGLQGVVEDEHDDWK